MQNRVDSFVPLTRAMPAQAMWGIFVRKERWSHSWRGRLIVASAVLLLGALVLRGVYPFLATTHRVNANILVVEGWIHEYAIRAAVKEFQSNHYQRVFTTGGPVGGIGKYINDFYTSASVGADLLKKCGLPEGRLQMVPSCVMDRDRTYGAAVALRNWFRDHNMGVSSIDVVTEDLHSRRTRLLFQKTFGKEVQIGTIAVPNLDYPTKRGCHYSQGLKDVVSEFAAYLYAKLLFFPAEPVHPRKASASLPSVHNRKVKIAVVGLGYVGYHSSSNLRDLCVNGLGIDVDPRKLPKPLNKIAAPRSPPLDRYVSTALPRLVVAPRSRERRVILTATQV
jgi:uncharacterized SAM-binding protein YcdF (DUF218 family)